MQTPTLLIQLAGAGANSAPQRGNASQPTDGAQFSHALSREMEQRPHSPAPSEVAPAKQPATPAPQHPSAVAPAPVKADQHKPAGASAEVDKEKDDAADAAAASPVAEMLALVASFNQPAAALVVSFSQPAAAPVADPASAAAQPAAAAVVKGSERLGFAAISLKGDIDGAAPAGGDKGPPPDDLAQALDGAGRFSMKGLDAGAKSADLALPRVTSEAGILPSGTGNAGAAATRKAASGPELAPAAVKAEATPLRAREGVADIAAIKEPATSAPLMAPVQQASLAMAQAVNGAPTDRIAARVGTPGWDNQIAQKIVWMVAGKEQSATLTLNPPDMGPMQVVLSVTNDQASVTFSAAQPEVRQALENAMPKLREMMGESGIALGNASVNAGSAEQRQAQQGEQPRNQGGGNRFGGGGDIAGTAETPQVTRTGGAGLVDTFA